jgi:hypothetical protein
MSYTHCFLNLLTGGFLSLCGNYAWGTVPWNQSFTQLADIHDCTFTGQNRGFRLYRIELWLCRNETSIIYSTEQYPRLYNILKLFLQGGWNWVFLLFSRAALSPTSAWSVGRIHRKNGTKTRQNFWTPRPDQILLFRGQQISKRRKLNTVAIYQITLSLCSSYPSRTADLRPIETAFENAISKNSWSLTDCFLQQLTIYRKYMESTFPSIRAGMLEFLIIIKNYVTPFPTYLNKHLHSTLSANFLLFIKLALCGTIYSSLIYQVAVDNKTVSIYSIFCFHTVRIKHYHI